LAERKRSKNNPGQSKGKTKLVPKKKGSSRPTLKEVPQVEKSDQEKPLGEKERNGGERESRWGEPDYRLRKVLVKTREKGLGPGLKKIDQG